MYGYAKREEQMRTLLTTPAITLLFTLVTGCNPATEDQAEEAASTEQETTTHLINRRPAGTWVFSENAQH
jgi:hypothetical protein